VPEVGEQAAAGRGAAAERVTDSSSNGSSAAEWVSDGSSNGSSVAERLAAQSLDALSSIVVHLPPGLLHRIAHLVGAGWYLVAPHQRKLARTNLRRVCGWLDANGMATPRVRAAAHDPRALERLLRDAFGHRARYYLEVAMNVRVDRAFLEQHLSFAEPALVERVLGQPGPAIVIGLHLGALEMPAQYITVVRGRRAVAPMETLRNRALQAYLERTRGRTGVEIIPARQARPALQRALARGDLVGLIADRTVGGPGVPVQLFGAPARLPAGPGVLAVETGVPAYAAAVTRTGWSTYRASVVPLAAPAAGSRHERARAFTDEMARAFERLIAQAPEQWWSIFQPIWD
jgi:lauroyl/myristoyl acyltransferase